MRLHPLLKPNPVSQPEDVPRGRLGIERVSKLPVLGARERLHFGLLPLPPRLAHPEGADQIVPRQPLEPVPAGAFEQVAQQPIERARSC